MSYNFSFKINNILTESQHSTVFDKKMSDVISSIQWELTIDDETHFMTNEYTTNFNLNINQFITTTELSPEHDETYNYPHDVFVMYKDITLFHVESWLNSTIDIDQIKTELQNKFESKLNNKKSKRICPWVGQPRFDVQEKFYWNEEQDIWIEKLV